jgi:putative intracellular protease/amidase
MVEFERRCFSSGGPIVAICHGPQLLIEAEVVTDANFITSRSPGHPGAFCAALPKRL